MCEYMNTPTLAEFSLTACAMTKSVSMTSLVFFVVDFYPIV
jgi:hypothetical protein